MDTFENRNSELKDDLIIDNENPHKSWKKPVIIISISLFIIIITSLILYLIVPLTKKENEEKFGEIKCIYNIKNSNDKSLIINDEYENFNNSILNIYINETKFNYKKYHNFTSEGLFELRFILNKHLYLDKIFKNINETKFNYKK